MTQIEDLIEAFLPKMTRNNRDSKSKIYFPKIFFPDLKTRLPEYTRVTLMNGFNMINVQMAMTYNIQCITLM